MLLKIGDHLVEAEMKDGVPVIKASYSETKVNENGGTDCIIHVPSISLKAKKEN